VHLTIALAFIVFKGALIGISALPEELAIAVLLVSLIFTFEAILDPHLLVSAHIYIVFWLLAPFTLPMFHPVKEFTCVCIAIGPLILAEAVWVAVAILPYVLIAICEEVRAIAVSKACPPLAFIPVPVGPDMHAISIGLACLPLAYI